MTKLLSPPLRLAVPVLPLLLACGEPAASAASAAQPTTSLAATPSVTTKLTLQVDGMVCEGCEGAIRDAVTALPGVTSCLASHTEKQAVIEYDPAAVQPAKLAEVIAALGYKVAPPGGTAPAPTH